MNRYIYVYAIYYLVYVNPEFLLSLVSICIANPTPFNLAHPRKSTSGMGLLLQLEN